MTILRFSLRVCGGAQTLGDQCFLFSGGAGALRGGSLVGANGGGGLTKSPVASGAMFSTHHQQLQQQPQEGRTSVWDRRYSAGYSSAATWGGALPFGRHVRRPTTLKIKSSAGLALLSGGQ